MSETGHIPPSKPTPPSEAEVLARVAAVPYARFLGLSFELAGDEMTAIMRFHEGLLGNPNLPAIHGGVLGALLEITALAQLAVTRRSQGRAGGISKPVGITVEYLRTGRPLDTFARAMIKRMGRRVATVHVEAWQEARDQPVAALHGHFLLPKDG